MLTITTDHAGDTGEWETRLARQIPVSVFEQELLRRLIVAEGGELFGDGFPVLDPDGHPSGYRFRVRAGEEWDEQGQLTCFLQIDREGDVWPGSGRVFPISFWVAERSGAASPYYSVVIGWEMPRNEAADWMFEGEVQANFLPHRPVLSLPAGATAAR